MLGFALAAVWFLRRQSGIAKGFSLGTWFVLGAFLIQIRGAPGGDAGILAFADGREVRIVAHVGREGYARAAGPRSVRQPVDVETETIEGLPIRAGVRLTIYAKVEDQGLPSEVSTTSGEPPSAAKADPDKQLFAGLKTTPPKIHALKIQVLRIQALKIQALKIRALKIRASM